LVQRQLSLPYQSGFDLITTDEGFKNIPTELYFILYIYIYIYIEKLKKEFEKLEFHTEIY
jgi:hypothetical protein